MELRTTEEKIYELTWLYEVIRQSPVLRPDQVGLLPPLSLPSSTNSAAKGNDPNNSVATESISKDNNAAWTSNQPPPPSNLIALVQSIQTIESALVEWQPKVEKFRKRLAEIDPVTEKPRYGPKARERVQWLVDAYDFLCQRYIPKETPKNSDPETLTSATAIGRDSALLFQEIQQQYANQLADQQKQQALHEQSRRSQEEEVQRQREQALAEQEAQERERAAQIAAEQAAKIERLHQQAEQARQQRRAQQEAQRQAEQNWLDSIVKGPDGVRTYVQELKKATTADLSAQSKALTSLFLIFDQIQRHPEEVNFRKIRLSHEGFHRDIGRHKGGIELLIAAGFRPTKLPTTGEDNGGSTSVCMNGNDIQEEVPALECLVSIEPNLEQDMDGWSAWYDLNKATFEILQMEVQKLKSS